MAELVALWPWLLIAFTASLAALVATLILAIGCLPCGAPSWMEWLLIVFLGASCLAGVRLLLIVARAFLLWLIR